MTSRLWLWERWRRIGFGGLRGIVKVRVRKWAMVIRMRGTRLVRGWVRGYAGGGKSQQWSRLSRNPIARYPGEMLFLAPIDLSLCDLLVAFRDTCSLRTPRLGAQRSGRIVWIACSSKKKTVPG